MISFAGNGRSPGPINSWKWRRRRHVLRRADPAYLHCVQQRPKAASVQVSGKQAIAIRLLKIKYKQKITNFWLTLYQIGFWRFQDFFYEKGEKNFRLLNHTVILHYCFFQAASGGRGGPNYSSSFSSNVPSPAPNGQVPSPAPEDQMISAAMTGQAGHDLNNQQAGHQALPVPPNNHQATTTSSTSSAGKKKRRLICQLISQLISQLIRHPIWVIVFFTDGHLCHCISALQPKCNRSKFLFFLRILCSFLKKIFWIKATL